MQQKKDPLDTPMMRQYLLLKNQYTDTVLFFRMGDFYEIFLEDARIAAPIMDIAVTHRSKEIPMAGVPYHSAEIYIRRLLEAGKNVAVAEQEPDPKNPKLMQRRVRRIITPATVLEDGLLDSLRHNYLMSMVFHPQKSGLAFADISTGDFFSFEVSYGKESSPCVERSLETFRDYYAKFSPKEVLLPVDLYKEFQDIPEREKFILMESWKANIAEGRRQIEDFYGQNLKGLGYDDTWSIALGAVSLILHYLRKNFPDRNTLLQAPVFRTLGESWMQLDEKTIKNLDLVENQNEKGSSHTLFGILDHCRTSSGKRFLRENILFPLLQKDAILKRQKAVSFLLTDTLLRKYVGEHLSKISDLERILSRIHAGKGAPRDFSMISSTIEQANQMQALFLQKMESCNKGEKALLESFLSVPEELLQIQERIHAEVEDEPPAVLPGNSPFIKRGVNSTLDRALDASQQGSRYISRLEEEERTKTKISSLKIKYNKIHGYFIEINRSQSSKIPPDYYRTQTLMGTERYSCPRLSELEASLGEAEATIQKIEYEYFKSLCQTVQNEHFTLKDLMKRLSEIDFFVSLAETAEKKEWVLPEFVDSAQMKLCKARHPVIEHYLSIGTEFVPNDLFLDSSGDFLAILTGPNMAGKSTFIRQTALIQLLAQMGSFVPAQKATLGIVDKIFTRIGSSDNLTRGESTFYTEMLETARILNQCSNHSLVIMDEIGRGTSTYDGLSLAWAIAEHLSDPEFQLPLTLFATHYHELTQLEENRAGVLNLRMEVVEKDGKMLFLHRVLEGSTDRSYGICVAQLAGIPASVIQRAKEKLSQLELQTGKASPPIVQQIRKKESPAQQHSLFS